MFAAATPARIERPVHGGGVLRGGGNQQAAGGLRVVHQPEQVLVDAGRSRDSPLEMLEVAGQPARPIPLRELPHAGEERHGRGVDAQRHVACRRHFAGVADKPESRDVGAPVNMAGGQGAHRLGGGAIERRHRSHGGLHDGLGRAPGLDRGADDAGADGLGQEQDVAGFRAGVREHAGRIDLAGDGVAELHFVVAHGVAAEQRHAGLAQLVEPAGEDGGDDGGIEIALRKPCDGERGQRLPAHGVDVAEGVGGGNLAVRVRVVDDGREEVDRLDKGRPSRPGVNARIVGRAEIKQDPRILLSRNATQDLGELARGEFARSTGAGDHFGQTLCHWLLVSGSGSQ